MYVYGDVFSHDGRYVICGSEDHCVYIWKTFPEVTKFSSTRRDRNENYECFTGIEILSLTGLPIGYSVIVALTGLPIGYSVIVALTGLPIG